MLKEKQKFRELRGSYKGNDAIGQLMHDFSCKDADDMYYAALKKGVRHFKEEEGRNIVCKAVEEYANARAKESAKESALNTKIEMIKNLMETMNISAQQAMNAMKIPGEEQVVLMPMIRE